MMNNNLVDETAKFFSENSPLKNNGVFADRAYEERPQQRELGLAVAKALQDNKHLCAEAPTGVGKSFAYLVPALLSVDPESSSKPIVISTHTINLQEQLIDKDVPTLEKILNREFKAVIAKGRGNYLCLRRLNGAASHQAEYLPNDDLIPEIDKIFMWSQNCKEGSRSELDFKVSYESWSTVNSEEGNCLNSACKFYKPCFFQRSRRALDNADIIIANHALFLSDLAIKYQNEEIETGILPNYRAVILDEGHTLENVATSHLGVRLTAGGVFQILNRLYNPKNNKGLLKPKDCLKARKITEEALKATADFFNQLDIWLEHQDSIPVKCTDNSQFDNLIGPHLSQLIDELTELIEPEEDAERKQEIIAAVRRCDHVKSLLDVFLKMSEPGFVYWIDQTKNSLASAVLNAVPINVGILLEDVLFGEDFPVVVTSATLAVDQRLSYFRNRVGMLNAEELILDTPFNFKEQVRLFIPNKMPPPKEYELFVEASISLIQQFLDKTKGRAFVLFTSYKMMYDVSTTMNDYFEERKYPLYVQGEGLSPTMMLEEFRKTRNSVIFGTDAFWTGVDVPGKSLSNVIIVKLPFAVPNHPIIEARLKAVEETGANSFKEYSLPEAVLKFRQGFGRLVRSKTDKGIILILDNRVTTSWYGKAFLKSVPECETILF